jgi:hypothetical protein
MRSYVVNAATVAFGRKRGFNVPDFCAVQAIGVDAPEICFSVIANLRAANRMRA